MKNAEFAELMKKLDVLQKTLEYADKTYAATYNVYKQALDLYSCDPGENSVRDLQFKLWHELIPAMDEIFNGIRDIKFEIHLEKYNLDMHISKRIQQPKRSKKC